MPHGPWCVLLGGYPGCAHTLRLRTPPLRTVAHMGCSPPRNRHETMASRAHLHSARQAPCAAHRPNRVRTLFTSVRNSTDCVGFASVLTYQYAPSHLLAASFCLYTAWLLIEMLHSGYSRFNSAPA